MPAPERFVAWLRQNQHRSGGHTFNYHPRSDRHQNALSGFAVEDLVSQCPAISADAGAGKLVYQLNADVYVGPLKRNVDLLIGEPVQPPGTVEGGMVRGDVAVIRIAVESKTIMTEHRKARLNRYGDLNAHHQHVHSASANAIAAALTLINISPRFASPTNQPKGGPGGPLVINEHPGPSQLVEETIRRFLSIPLRHTTNPAENGLEANSMVVINCDNLGHVSLHTRLPSPPIGAPHHYISFIRRVCDLYRQRFSGP